MELTGRRKGYSLIELLVVLGILALLGATGLPNFFGQNDRYLLDNAANQVRQALLEAKIRSIAPSKSRRETAGAAGAYQVRFGPFSETGGAADNLATGNPQTTEVVLEKGLIRCDQADQAGLTLLRQIVLPRGVYIASFFPAISPSPDSYEAVVRFSAGKAGFSCGAADAEELAESLDFSQDSDWLLQHRGADLRRSSANAYIELTTNRFPESRYVVINRYTSNIDVLSVKPDIGFDPAGDSLPPEFDSQPFQGLLVICRTSESSMVLRFSRAVDQLLNNEDPPQNVTDPNRPVYYDIDLQTDTGSRLPVVRLLSYTTDQPEGDIVIYSFTTSAVTISNQPAVLTFYVSPVDRGGNRGLEREMVFNKGTHWSCANRDPGTGSTVAPGTDAAGNPVYPEPPPP